MEADTGDHGPADKGSDAYDIRRIGYVESAIIHGALAFAAAQSITGTDDSSGDIMTVSIMAYPRSASSL